MNSGILTGFTPRYGRFGPIAKQKAITSTKRLMQSYERDLYTYK
jgi:hypothetical protein